VNYAMTFDKLVCWLS